MKKILVMSNQGNSISILTALITAMQLANMKKEVNIEFGQDAIIAFTDRFFPLPPLLSGHASELYEGASKMGVKIDPLEMLKLARSMGIHIYVAEVWVEALGIRDKLPSEIEIISMEDTIKLILESEHFQT